MTSKLGALALALTVAAAPVALAAPAFAHGMGRDMGHTIDTSKDQSSQHGSNTVNKTMTQGQTHVAGNSGLSRIVMTFERKHELAQIVALTRESDKAVAAKNQQLGLTLYQKAAAIVVKFYANGGTYQEITTALQRAGVPFLAEAAPPPDSPGSAARDPIPPIGSFL